MDRQSQPAPAASAPAGLLIIGHGTRSDVGRTEFHTTVERIRRLMPHGIVEAGFLEAGEPSMETAWQRIVARGAGRVVVTPLLLFAAGHAKQDIPLALNRFAEQSPMVRIDRLPPLGCDPSLVQLSVSRYQHAIDTALAPPVTAARTRLLFVARGASDPAARRQAQDYGNRVAAAANPDDHMTCFLAVAEPSFDQAVMASAAAPFDRVVVLPHLLFAGSLLFRLREQIAQQDQASTRQQWLMGDHLGPDPAVAQIIARRFSLVLPSSNVQP